MNKIEVLAERYEEVCDRIEFANLLGLDLLFRVSCLTCCVLTTMSPNELLEHIELHLRQERKKAA